MCPGNLRSMRLNDRINTTYYFHISDIVGERQPTPKSSWSTRGAAVLSSSGMSDARSMALCPSRQEACCVWSASSPCGWQSLARTAGVSRRPKSASLAISPLQVFLIYSSSTPRLIVRSNGDTMGKSGNLLILPMPPLFLKDEMESWMKDCQYPWRHCHLTLQGSGGRPVTERICREHDSVVNIHRVTV